MQVLFHSSLQSWKPGLQYLAGYLDKWHDLCKSREEAEKFLSRINLCCRRNDLRTTAGEIDRVPPPVFAFQILT